MVILSDPVDLRIPKLGRYRGEPLLPRRDRPSDFARRLAYELPLEGRRFHGPAFDSGCDHHGMYYWLCGIDVLAPPEVALVVALGDSITESFRSTPDTNRSWPSVLSVRFASNKKTANLAVGNMGMGGNRVLRDNTGRACWRDSIATC